MLPRVMAQRPASDGTKKADFERSLGRLEEVVRKLENANLTLDDAMKLFEEGVELSRVCQKQLEEAEGRVEILLKKADGKIVAEPFETAAPAPDASAGPEDEEPH